MGTDNTINQRYVAQARNVFEKLGLNSKGKGVKVNEEAMQLFGTLHFGASKYEYVKSTDTNNDGHVSVNELAEVLGRAAKENSFGFVASDKKKKDDDAAVQTALLSDFLQHGATSYLLGEAKKVNPAKYAQVEQRLKDGTFTISGEYSDNLFREKQDGTRLATAISKTIQEYETLETISPKLKGAFFDKLANGEALAFLMPSSKTRDTDSFEKKLAQGLCQNVFTKEKLDGYEKEILANLNDRQKFSQFITRMGAEVQKQTNLQLETEVKTPIFVIDEKFEDRIAGFDWTKNEIQISYPVLISVRDEMKSKGASAEEIGQELIRQIIEVVPHEYLHAGQYAKAKKPFKTATPEQLAVAESWGKNFDNYLYVSDSIKQYGSISAYAKQPIERSANNLMTDIDRYYQKYRADKKVVKAPDKHILAKQETPAKQGV